MSEWFDVWKEKLSHASGIVILYTDDYRARFKEGPLRKEAEAIIEKKEQDSTFMVYVLDPDTCHRGGKHHNTSDVRANLQDKVHAMGDLKGWEAFVANCCTEL